MLLDGVLVFREVDAERLVIYDVRMLPLGLAGELGQRAVGCRGGIELFAIEIADARQMRSIT